MSAGTLVRFHPDSRREEMKADFTANFEGRQPDIMVRANDIESIPGSRAKTLWRGLLGAFPAAAGRNVIVRWKWALPPGNHQ